MQESRPHSGEAGANQITLRLPKGRGSNLLLREELVPNREALHAANKARVQAVDGTRELDFGDSRKKVAVSDLHLHSSKMSAQAEMLSNSEPDMAIRLAVDLEVPRIFEDFFVAIRRGVVERDGLAFEDRLIPKLIVLGRRSSKMNDRRRPPSDFFDRILQHPHVRLKPAQFALMLDEGEHAAGRAVSRRFIAGDYDDEAPGEHFHVV